MRKSLLIFIGAIALASCSKEITEQEVSMGQSQSIEIPEGYVRLDVSVDTKATMSGLDVIWEEGDKVIVNEQESTLSYDSEKNCWFIVAQEAESYEAIYPAEIYTQWKGVMVPDAQFYREGSFARCSDLMAASGSSTNLSFQHVFGILHFKLTGSAEIASVNIKDNAGASLCGYLSKDSTGAWKTWSSTLKYDNLTVNCKKPDGSGLVLGSGKDFYIPLPAGEYNKGFTITVSEKNGHAMVLESSTPRSIKAGDILSTPDIAYSVPANQVYEYHFDNLAFGGDPVSGTNRGFAHGTSAEALTGYEIAKAINAATTAGSPNISSVWDTVKKFSLSDSYISSRNLQDFNLLFDTWEYHGYLAGGFGTSAQSRAILRLPTMSNIPKGQVCKVRLSFKFAWQSAQNSSDPLMIYPHFSGSGKILGYKIDGVEIDIDKALPQGRWATADDTLLSNDNPNHRANHVNENLLILPSEMNDYKWHDVEILLGACTSTTVVNLQSFSKGTKAGAFFIDDIKAYTEPYPALDGSEYLHPSMLTTLNSATALRNAKAQALALGMDYLDAYLGTSYLYNTLAGDTDKWLEEFTKYAAELKEAGIKIWAVHMPYECLVYDDHYFDLIAPTAADRAAAVERHKKIMTALEPLKPHFYVLHPSIHGDFSWSANKANLKAGLNALIAHAAGLSGTVAIENIMRGVEDPTGGWPSTSICFHPQNMNELCSDCPGLKFAFDASHAIVKASDNAQQYSCEAYAKALGTNIGTIHVHDSDGSEDYHLYPGYSGSLFAHQGNINWGAVYKTLVEDCAYNGPFVYEMSTYAIDCIASFSGVADNYYGYVLEQYKKTK